MVYSVGQDIESICGKCGDVWHVVVAIAKGKIAKVVCKQCNGQHRYKPPEGAAVATPRKKTTRAASAGTKKKTSRKKEPEPEGPLVQPDPARPLRSYRIAESFDVGDPVEHKTFGTGVVELVLEDRKIQVYFDIGRKVLAHQRA